MPGFALTVDYYRIKVRDVISGLTGQAIINRCYDDPTGINNEFCGAISRQASTTNPLANFVFAGQSTRTINNVTYNFPTTGNAFINQPYNFAALVRRGVDFDASYNRRLWGDVRFSGHAIVSLLLESENFSYLTQPDRSDKIDEGLGDPRWGATWNGNLDFGKFDVTYSGVYVGRQAILAWETQFSHRGRGPTEPRCPPDQVVPVADHAQHARELGRNLKARLYAGVDNIANLKPPYDLWGNEAGSNYNPTGRFFYGGAEVKFR